MAQYARNERRRAAMRHHADTEERLAKVRTKEKPQKERLVNEERRNKRAVITSPIVVSQVARLIYKRRN